MVEQKDIKGLSEAEKEMLILELQQKLEVVEKERTQLEQRLALHQRWSRLRGKLFPTDCRGKVVNRISIDLLEADFFGCITTFTTRGKLNAEQMQYLVATCEKLNSVVDDLQGYSGYYFRQLGLIGSLILEFEQRYPK
ncbi:MAG: hypothetical protein ABI977_07980 [Acidobacteriota bacterium]